MSKKQKRQVSPTTPAPRAVSAQPAVKPAPTTAEFNPDYSYVIKDLKRIGLLAGSFFTILVVLSFFLR